MAPRYRSGFTLIEIVVVLLIFSVVIAMAAAITRGLTASQKRSLTATRMATLEAALVQFVQQTRRLPCPADGTVASSVNGAGREDPLGGGVCANNQQNGIIPYRTLGLTEADATDGWYRRFTYRVYPDLALANGMDMSLCDPAGGAVGAATVCAACTSGSLASCTTPNAFVLNRGITVKNLIGNNVMDPTGNPPTGAAYVLISHGESGGGAYLSSGTVAASVVGDGTEEAKNHANLVHTKDVTYYVDNDLVETAGPGHFDDIVSHPSIMAVATRAALGPRSH